MRTVSATAEIAATGFFNEAALSAASALTSEGLADGHRSAAATSADAAMNSAASADNFADAALSSVVNAQSSANAANNSADAALGHANAASGSAGEAAGSVASISGFADAASDSADAAAGSVASISDFADAASGSADAAAQSVIDAADASRLTLGTVTTSAPGAGGSVTITGATGAQVLNFVVPQGPQGIGPVTIADAAPVSPTDGMLWMRTTTEILYLYSSAQSRWIIPYALDVDRELDSDDEFLSLNLQFSRDKTLIARRGPTPTFSRASGGTYVGSDGLIHGIDSSGTSNSISIASKTFTLDAPLGQDQKWRAGDVVEASNGVNFMVGTVTSYTPSTQVLVCNMTSIGGTGTFDLWRVSYRGPRFDHDPLTLACKGLLIEEARTNLYQQSEVFNDSFWTKTRSSISSNATTAPDGTLTADKLVEDTTASNTHITQSTVTPPATAHTLSVFAKKGERTWIVLRLGGTNTFFNLDDGTIAAGSVNSPTITNFGNGWYRCAVTSSFGTQGQFWLATNSTTTSYTGDGTSGLFIWGAQLEAGAFPTSYIPTAATAPLTRSADVCSITGSAFSGFYNQSEGTISYKASTAQPGNSVVVYSVTDGTTSNLIQSCPGPASFLILRLGASEVSLNHGTFTIGVAASQASAYKLNDFASAKNGEAVLVDSTGTPPSVSQIGLGSQNVAAGRINGHIAYFRYYKKRLTNFKLQSLTS